MGLLFCTTKLLFTTSQSALIDFMEDEACPGDRSIGRDSIVVWTLLALYALFVLGLFTACDEHMR